MQNQVFHKEGMEVIMGSENGHYEIYSDNEILEKLYSNLRAVTSRDSMVKNNGVLTVNAFLAPDRVEGMISEVLNELH